MTSLRFHAAAAFAAILPTGSAAAPVADPRPGVAAEATPARAQERPAVLPGAVHCVQAGREGERGYRFILPCAGRAPSPDGRYAVVVYGEEASGVLLTGANGRVLGEVAGLNDAMPFVLSWSPRSDRFFANHYLGSGQDRLRLFDIAAGGGAVELPALFAEAAREMVRRHPCLGRGASIAASGRRWSRDGRRIAMVVYARPDACGERDERGAWRTGPDWDPLWMIGDAETGRIDPASVRVRRGGVGPMPSDGPYAGL